MKLALTVLLFLSYGSMLNAQVWIDSGAVWHYNIVSFGSTIDGFRKVRYTKDTLIHGFNCQKIESEEYTFGIMNNQGDYGVTSHYDLAPQFTYVNGDTVFYYNNGVFFVLYDFGASIGDSWVISTSPNPLDPLCPDTSIVNVVDTGVVVMNGLNYRTITIESASASSYNTQSTIVERFGAMDQNFGRHRYLFPIRLMCSIITMEIPTYSLKCFEDKSFALYNPSGQDCEYLLNILQVDEAANPNWTIYPNPAKGQISIEGVGLEIADITIVGLLGGKVFEVENFDLIKPIDVSNFKSGTYIVRIATQSIVRTEKIVIF